MATQDATTTAYRLRATADWLDAHPTAQTELLISESGWRIIEYHLTAEALAERARDLKGRWMKRVDEGNGKDRYFWLVQEIVQGVTYELYASRALVCERVVVPRTVWRCAPVLAQAGTDVAA